MADVLVMVSAAMDASDGIARDEGMPLDIDEATRDAMLRRLVEPLRRELGSGQ